MKKTTLALSALALSLGLALSPLSATAAETSSATTAQQMPSLAPMLEKVMPSVVSINVVGSTTVNTPRMPRNFQQFFGDDSPFCQEGSPFQSSPFCQGGQGGNGGGQQQKFMALGSGVIIDADKGRILHGLGKTVATLGIRRCAAVLRAVLPQVFPADCLVAGPPAFTARPAALVAEKFQLVF